MFHSSSSFLVLSMQAYCCAATPTWKGANVLGNLFRLYLHPVWQHEKKFQTRHFHKGIKVDTCIGLVICTCGLNPQMPGC